MNGDDRPFGTARPNPVILTGLTTIYKKPEEVSYE